MINKLSLQPSEKIPFSKINHFIITGAKEAVAEFTASTGKLLMIYSLLTVISLVLDVIVIFIGLSGLNSDVGAFSTVFVFLLGVVYFFIAFYFIGWVIAVRQRLPEYAQAQVMMGLFGLFKKMTFALDTKYAEMKGLPLPNPDAQPAGKPAVAKPAQNKPTSADKSAPSAGGKLPPA